MVGYGSWFIVVNKGSRRAGLWWPKSWVSRWRSGVESNKLLNERYASSSGWLVNLHVKFISGQIFDFPVIIRQWPWVKFQRINGDEEDDDDDEHDDGHSDDEDGATSHDDTDNGTITKYRENDRNHGDGFCTVEVTMLMMPMRLLMIWLHRHGLW